MNADKNLKVRRVGCCWVDEDLLEEGYDPNDLVDTRNSVIELPELLDREESASVGWMVCPHCGERSQVNRFEPVCPRCDWSPEPQHPRSDRRAA